jgi:hypothetical protein
MVTLGMTFATLVMLILGITLTTAGIAGVEDLPTSGLAVMILLILGVIFLAISFVARRGLSDPYLPESSTVLALYVPVEFLAGALLVYIGIVNTVFDSETLHWSFAAVAGFGLLLVTDSLLLYRRDIKQVAGKRKGV